MTDAADTAADTATETAAETDTAAGAAPTGPYHVLMSKVRALYDWVLSWADSRYGTWALFVLAFAESSFFPIPPDVLLIALCVGRPKRAPLFAGVCAVGSVLGGIAGYGIGVFAADFGKSIIAFFGPDYLELAKQAFDEHGLKAVLISGLTPVPYKVFTIASGIFHEQVPLMGFIGASAASRSFRFFLVAGLIRIFGAPVKAFIDRWFNVLSIAFVVLLIGGFVVIKWALA